MTNETNRLEEQHAGDRSPVRARSEAAPNAPRNAWAAFKSGLRGRCPACGQGRILRGYLTVNESCPVCHEEFYHHRADDFPPYVTIFVVGHILGGLMFAVDEVWPDIPMTYHFMVWPALCIALSLLLLPRFKSALIAYQWALRMHGFETAHVPPARLLEPGKSLRRQSAA